MSFVDHHGQHSGRNGAEKVAEDRLIASIEFGSSNKRRLSRVEIRRMKTIRFAFPACLFVTALLSFATTFAADPKSPAAQGVKNVGVEEFDKLRADKKNVVLDVRTAREFATGHIAGAVNIDWNGADFEKQAAALDKSKTYLVHCAAGGRSAKACALMNGKLNFPSCYNLEGGMRAWEKAGKPVEK
jgi:rhodanese-related sulfurtransferase